ncbi:MAG: carbohydrate kinase [Cyclobacteriaceae bacterium]|nr:carbohydrate kinase [Cyclobacteriaceae bacterium]
MPNYLLGIDIGSSSVKASFLDAESGQVVAAAYSPSEEMPMLAVKSGWAEQDAEMWWEHVIRSTRSALLKSGISSEQVKAIGISYQMHGLVVVGKDHKPLRPAIIWCDSRSVTIGQKATQALGEKYCLEHFLNSPGNFTASKLRWVKENEPSVFEGIEKIMLPGDYIAMKLTGEICTTDTGLSEGIFWDYNNRSVSQNLLDYYGIPTTLLPRQVPVFGEQGLLRDEAAHALGLRAGIRIAYRAGDQPNNAFSLNVLNPGETAATAGTSGVIYGVTDTNAFDAKSRVNTFIHVNNQQPAIRNGVLLCVNGTGILNSWLRKNTKGNGSSYDYEQMNILAAQAPIGSDGLRILPFGNGAERIFENREVNASFHGLNFNRHSQAHIFRAAQEGIVFALKYGFDILKEMGLHTNVIRAGNANMFLSPLFREAFVNTIGARLELFDTDGSKGAAIGAGIGAGIYSSFAEAFQGLKMIRFEEANADKKSQYTEAYQHWLACVTNH